MQVNQNVNAANFLLVSSQTGSVASAKENTSNSVDFASALQNANDNRQYQDTADFAQNKVSSIAKKVSDSVDTRTRVGVAKADDTSTNESVKVEKENPSQQPTKTKEMGQAEENPIRKTDSPKETETSEAMDVAAMEDMEGLEELSDEELALLLETVGNLLQNVMEQFGLSLEEITAKLEEFNMQPEDLLTQDGLKEFFLQMNGANVSDLVVDENLNMQLQSFLGTVSEELSLIQGTTVDVENVIADFDMKTLLEKATADITSEQMVDDVTVGDNEVVLGVCGDANSEITVADEPEVIINDNRTQNNNQAASDSDNQQTSDDTQQAVTTKETVTETSTRNQTSFENPILQAIQNAVNNVEGAIISEQPVQQTDVVRQIVEQVRLNMNQQQTSLELQLYPEHLGRIQINVVSKEGVMTASIVAETEAAKQAIEAGLLNLKEAMEQQNLKVEAIEVMVSTMGFEKGDEQQQSFDEKGSSNPRRKIDLSELGEEIQVEDEAEVEKMKASGSSVSYRA